MVDQSGQHYLPPPNAVGVRDMIVARPQTWAERHLSVIVTVAVLSLGGAATWGRMLTGFDNYDDRLSIVEAVIRAQPFADGPAINAEQNRRLLLLESAMAAITGTIADMRAYDARMEERLAGLTSQLSRIELAITKLSDSVSEFTRLAIP